jgi:hypothetical protein
MVNIEKEIDNHKRCGKIRKDLKIINQYEIEKRDHEKNIRKIILFEKCLHQIKLDYDYSKYTL